MLLKAPVIQYTLPSTESFSDQILFMWRIWGLGKKRGDGRGWWRKKKNAEREKKSLERDDERDVFIEEKRCCQGTGK